MENSRIDTASKIIFAGSVLLCQRMRQYASYATENSGERILLSTFVKSAFVWSKLLSLVKSWVSSSDRDSVPSRSMIHTVGGINNLRLEGRLLVALNEEIWRFSTVHGEMELIVASGVAGWG
jgi:hypothetical protein